MEADRVKTCDQCSKDFQNKKAYEKHLLAHKKYGKDLLACKICDTPVQDKSALSHHMYKHSKTAKIKCLLCGCRLYQPGDKKKHMRDKHELADPQVGVDYTKTPEEEMIYQTREEYEAEKKPDRSGQ